MYCYYYPDHVGCNQTPSLSDVFRTGQCTIQTGLVYPVAYVRNGQREHAGGGHGRARALGATAAVSEPQTSVTLQPRPVSKPRRPGASAVLPTARTALRGDQRRTGEHQHAGRGTSVSPAVPETETLSSYPPTNSAGGKHHDAARYAAAEAPQQGEGARHAATCQPQTHSPAAWL